MIQKPNRFSKRFLGLELAGAKNQKTSLAVLEYFPKEQKTFLLDIFDKISPRHGQTGDEALLEVIQEELPGAVTLGVNVPLHLPPCITCTRKHCPLPSNCVVPTVKWMRDSQKKSHREFTPYTQRPIELWIKHQVMSKLSRESHFDLDETLGGSKAPLTARMHFLKRHIPSEISVLEVWPKLSVALLADQIAIPKRFVSTYRHLENGIHSREEILHGLTKSKEIFIYDRDLHKLAGSLTAFDAFICAYTVLLENLNQCASVPKGFPVSSGWVYYPGE